jgi:hypothetical protein
MGHGVANFRTTKLSDVQMEGYVFILVTKSVFNG